MSPGPDMNQGAFEHSIGSRAFDTLRQGVRACVEHGDIQTPNIDMTAQALWASVHGVTALFITMQGFPFVPRAVLIDHTIPHPDCRPQDSRARTSHARAIPLQEVGFPRLEPTMDLTRSQAALPCLKINSVMFMTTSQQTEGHESVRTVVLLATCY